MARMLDAKKQYEEAQKHSSYKKIIDGIQKMSLEARMQKE